MEFQDPHGDGPILLQAAYPGGTITIITVNSSDEIKIIRNPAHDGYTAAIPITIANTLLQAGPGVLPAYLYSIITSLLILVGSEKE
jgi:hypothetical protein